MQNMNMKNQAELLENYKNVFVQPVPRFSVKTERGWRSRNYPIPDYAIRDHLAKKYTVATLGRWYPEYAILDLDDISMADLEKIRSEMGLDDSNSMLFTSESPNSYHLITRPTYNDKPPTINLLQNSIKAYANSRNIEIYPQKNRAIRLPFGKSQVPVDYKYAGLNSWTDMLFWLNKTDEFDLKTIRLQQMLFDFPKIQGSDFIPSGIFQQGRGLFEYGLQMTNSRHEAEYKVLYYLWRSNVAIDEAIRSTWRWIRTKHNGFSRDIKSHPKRVKYEIQKQANWIYSKYDSRQIYPDSTHNLYRGVITKSDLFEILEVTKGSLPRSRFLFQLIKHAYPRRHRAFIGIHRDKLVGWASERTYKRYLNELDAKNIIKRGKAYSVGRFSKDVKFNWPFKDSNQAILYEGRSVDTFDNSLKLIHKPQDYADKLKSVGLERRTVHKSVKIVFGST